MSEVDKLLGRAMTYAEPQYLMLREARVDVLQDGAEVEDADLWPVMLIVDSDRRQVPRLVIERVRRQVLHFTQEFALADIEASQLLPAWQKSQFKADGYTVIALPVAQLVRLPRGRRQLRDVESRLLVALRVWTCALVPQIELLIGKSEVSRTTKRLQNFERTNDALRHMLDAGADRPRDRDDLAERLRDGKF